MEEMFHKFQATNHWPGTLMGRLHETENWQWNGLNKVDISLVCPRGLRWKFQERHGAGQGELPEHHEPRLLSSCPIIPVCLLPFFGLPHGPRWLQELFACPLGVHDVLIVKALRSLERKGSSTCTEIWLQKYLWYQGLASLGTPGSHSFLRPGQPSRCQGLWSWGGSQAHKRPNHLNSFPV